MNKTQLIAAVAKEGELSKKDSAKAVNAIIKVLTETIGKKEKILLVGFGNFEVHKRAARKAFNPSTGKPVKVPAKNVVAFHASKMLKEAVNAKKK